MAIDWSKTEVEAAVEDYFNMLKLELTGQKYNKTEHRRALMERLNGRSDGSVELKHQNISAVLIEMGIPYIDGYKPRGNYQRSLLPKAVTNYIENNPEVNTLLKADSEIIPEIPSIEDFLSAMDAPPIRNEYKGKAVTEAQVFYNPSGINYLEREAQNQSLGEAGEQFVMNYERARLIHAGKGSLADRIEQVSTSIGASVGFDIRSFEANGSDRFIEAKTTKYGKNTPFFITPNELRFAQENAAQYFLYRVFRFRSDPHLFTLRGNLRDQCILEPSSFIARIA